MKYCVSLHLIINMNKTITSMKRVNSIKYLMMVMMATVCVSFSACGGDDKDDDLPEGSSYVGIHRIDVQFSDNATGLLSTAIFNGIKPNGSWVSLYENGKSLDLGTYGTWTTNEIRPISVETENGCVELSVSIVLMSKGVAASSDVSVTTIGYINNKKIATKVFTLPAGKKTLSLGFSTDEGGTSGYVIDSEVIE
jgi:hypothetical protein